MIHSHINAGHRGSTYHCYANECAFSLVAASMPFLINEMKKSLMKIDKKNQRLIGWNY